MSNNRPYSCPFCGRDSTVGDSDYDIPNSILYTDNADGVGVISTEFTVCPNPGCKKPTLKVMIFKKKNEYGSWVKSTRINEWQLIPFSKAKVFPEYIPPQILNDYNEACSILNLSPKASATLARRCLQGMIRDFWGVKKPDDYKGKWSLYHEIDALKETKVDQDVWGAMDALRKVGNIGAHMEEDIDLIVDIDPEESEKLIGLIEMLLNEWYINRHKRQERLTEVKLIAELKQEKRQQV